MRRRVVITGIGIVSPVGIGVEPFWNAVRHGRSGVRRLTAFDPSSFPCQIAAEVQGFRPEDFLDARAACRMGRHSQFAVAAARLATADGQLELDRSDRSRCGAVLGCCFGDMAASTAEERALTNSGPRRVSPLLIPLQLGSMAAGEVAIQLGLRGVNYVVSAACASANHAIGLAARHIAHGEADLVFAGGTEAPLTPLLVAGTGRAGTRVGDHRGPQRRRRRTARRGLRQRPRHLHAAQRQG